VVDGDCSTLPSADWRLKCETFIENERRYVFPALEELTGVRMSQCYEKISIVFREHGATDYGLGYSVIYGAGLGRIEETFSATIDPFGSFEGAPLLFDHHEPLHLAYSCLRVPAMANYDHSFFEPVEAELATLIAEHGGPAQAAGAAAESRSNAAYWVNNIGSHPEFSQGTGVYGGCHGAETLALYAAYGLEGASLVRTFFDRLRTRSELRPVEPNDWGMSEDEYRDFVLGLVPVNAPFVSQIAERCVPSADGGTTSDAAPEAGDRDGGG
jgi:hypothetical protein